MIEFRLISFWLPVLGFELLYSFKNAYIYHRLAKHKQQLKRFYFSSETDTLYFIMKRLHIVSAGPRGRARGAMIEGPSERGAKAQVYKPSGSMIY